MPEAVPVTLLAAREGAQTQGTAVVKPGSLGGRAANAGKVFGASVVASLIILPIPIVHFGIPLMLLLGLVLAGLQMRPGIRLKQLEGPCPHCGVSQKYWVGLGLSPISLPLELNCESCRKIVIVESIPAAS